MSSSKSPNKRARAISFSQDEEYGTWKSGFWMIKINCFHTFMNLAGR